MNETYLTYYLTIYYGFGPENHYRINDYETKEFTSKFSLTSPEGDSHQFLLNLPGKHNVLNAVAASVLSIEEDIPVLNIQSALSKFSGINRRMELLGKIDTTLVIDDYGHHPTEIKNTVLALKESFPDFKINMIFQPHRFTRTKDLFDDFLKVLPLVDELILLDIYSAGEDPIEGISSSRLLENLKDNLKVSLASTKEEVLDQIESSFIKGKDILLIQGAGNVSEISTDLRKKYNL